MPQRPEVGILKDKASTMTIGNMRAKSKTGKVKGSPSFGEPMTIRLEAMRGKERQIHFLESIDFHASVRRRLKFGST